MDDLEKRYAQGRFGRFAPTATVDIDAPVDVVWSVLTDFPRYAEWNRFTPSVVCGGRLGDTVTMEVHFPGEKPRTQVEVLNVLEPPNRIAWGVTMGSRAIMVANRYQTLEPLDGGCTRYATIDYVSGLLAPLVKVMYAQKMRDGFQLFADGLKEYVERER
jgi:uncharacterized protein YndB with AHSA1/START domain